MVDPIIIDDGELARRIQGIARQEHRSVQDVLVSMVSQYQPQAQGDPLPDAEGLALQVRLAAYQRARAYWRAHQDKERAAMTDEQLAEQFWLFDADGVPRLKADQGSATLPEGSLHVAGSTLTEAGFRSGQADVSSRSREILESEYADYLLKRMNRPVDNDHSSAA